MCSFYAFLNIFKDAHFLYFTYPLLRAGIADSKFRYHGGKLCEHLCNEVAPFDEALYHHMTREFTLCRDHYDRGASVLGTAFFFAELIRLKRDYRGALCALLDLACVIGSDDAFRLVLESCRLASSFWNEASSSLGFAGHERNL